MPDTERLTPGVDRYRRASGGFPVPFPVPIPVSYHFYPSLSSVQLSPHRHHPRFMKNGFPAVEQYPECLRPMIISIKFELQPIQQERVCMMPIADPWSAQPVFVQPGSGRLSPQSFDTHGVPARIRISASRQTTHRAKEPIYARYPLHAG